MTDSVSSQPTMRCHAGRANRKKLSGLPKIGSAALLTARGAYQNSASVGHSSIIAAPVTPAITSEAQNATKIVSSHQSHCCYGFLTDKRKTIAHSYNRILACA